MSTFCSCIICKKEISTKGFHSHFVRAHTVDGNIAARQNGLSSASKNKQNADQKNNIIRIQYANNPSHCKECDCCLPYDNRHNKFCNNSCAAKYNNLKKDYTKFKPGPKKGITKVETISMLSYRPKFTKVNCCKICNKWFVGTNKTCSTICRNISFSLTAKKSKLGGNKNTRAYGWYHSKFAGKVWLESSYEYKVAVELDNNNINWARPKSLFYTLDNIQRRYYPDFFLEDYNIYLDPKNDYLIIKDKEKIESVIVQNNVNVIILTKHQLTWKTILKLIG